MEKHIYDAYIADGWKLFALYRAKEPHQRVKGVYGTPKGWNDMSIPSHPYNPKAVYGGVPPQDIFVIDYDVKNGKVGETSKKALEEALGKSLYPTVISATGGGHVYVRTPEPIRPLKNQYSYPDIDFQCHGSEWVMCGGQYVEGYGEYTFDDPIEEYFVNDINEPFTMLTMRNEDKRNGNYGGVDETDHFLTRPSIDKIEALLDKLDPNMTYEGGWHNVIMALNSWDMGGEVGLRLAIEWSQRATNYEPTDDEIAEKYHQSAPETPDFYKKIFGMVNRGDLKSFKSRIVSAETLSDLEDIAKDVSTSTISSDDRASIGEALAKKAKEDKHDSRLRVPYWKKLCAMNFSIAKEETETSWLENIVYVESLSPSYYFLDTKGRYSAAAAQGRYSVEFEILAKQLGMKSLTLEAALRKGLITRCATHEYNPTEDILFKDSDGELVLNTFRHNSVPPIAVAFSEKGLELIGKFEDHLKNLMSVDEANILLDWMAYGVQNKGKKILWVPLIQSAEGLGKSIIGELLINHCYGNTNSGTADPEMVTGGQSAWATDRMLRVIEELRLSGHNRYEIVDSLKTFITNSIVSRSEKYERTANVPNRCNFIAFTNHKDALPLSEDARRWWVVYSRQPSMQALEEHTGVRKSEYFAPLWELARSGSPYGAEFHKWMMERDISKFEPSFAPESIHKARMMASEDTKTEYLAELKALLSVESKGVTSEIVSTKCLRQAMQSEHWEGDIPKDHVIAGLLRRLGYSKYDGKIRHKGETHYVWYKNEGMSADAIQELFHRVMELADVLSDFDVIEEI